MLQFYDRVHPKRAKKLILSSMVYAVLVFPFGDSIYSGLDFSWVMNYFTVESVYAFDPPVVEKSSNILILDDPMEVSQIPPEQDLLLLSMNNSQTSGEVAMDMEPIVAEPEPIIDEPEPTTYKGITEGDVLYDTVISHYSVGPGECKPYKDGNFYTADGTMLWLNMENPRIIACNWLPMGSILLIDGIEYTVRDKGGHSRLKKVGGVDMFLPEGAAACRKRGLRCDVPITVVFINV